MAVGQRLIVRAKRIEAQIGRFNDQRLETISEVIHGIISVKLFGWCSKFIQVVGIKRAVQLEALWQRSKVWSLLNLWTVGMMPVIIFVVLFVYSFNGRLDGETTFTAIAVFRVLQRAIFWMPGGVSHAISIYVSLKRIDEYLQEEDVQPAAERVEAAGHDVGFSQAQLVWKRADDGAAAEEETPLLLHGRQPEDSQAFALRNLTVRFPQGGLTIIGGPTGSGKSSLLSALVDEMTVVSGKIHIPMSANGVMSDIAYVSQEPWLRNATIRDNVLFGELYIRDRYEEVLRMCGLKPDLRTFVAGDQSEVGERGITLSGGQKQRVALARAVYSSRRILLIDDCLSAVDSHTGKHILHTCLLSQSPLMHGRTRILVTHHMAMCLPHCQYVVMMRSGEIVAKGTPQEVSGCAFDDVVAASDGESQGEQAPAVQRQALEDPMPEDEYNDERRAPADTPAAAGSQTGMQEASPTGQLIKEEVRMSGTIKASVWAGYFVASGGWVHVVFCAILIVAVQLLSAYKDYYLALRVGSDKSHDSESFQYAWLFIYLLVSLSSSVLRMVAMLLTYHGGLRASTILHERLTNAVMYATPHFMTTTPIGRTLARFAKDFQVIDESIALSMFDFATSFVIASSTLVIISAAVPLFAVVGIAVLGAYTSFTLDFMLSQRELKRLESTVFAPVLSLYSELIQGIDTIRGFGMQEAYMGEFTERFTEYVASDLTFRSTRRWLGSRMGLTSSLVGATTTVFILWKVEYFTSGLAGFIMIIAVNFWLESMGVVRRYCNLEMGFNSVERVFQYLEIDQEAPAKSSVGNKPCPGWPLRGEIEVRDLVAGYFANEPVLHGLSFSVCAGEKIGIVGRTGAGKSTLSLSLLRFVEATSGQVLIDGVDISKIGLEDLRQNITIVPQDPVLFNGTIRFNLDPFGEYPDEILLDALKRTLLLKSTHESAGDRSVAVFDSLDDEIISNGQNLSLGQRQLVALARTLTRRSKVILMDEATASVDFETDEAMQRTIRGAEFKSSTILCIAHRLHTIIDYDRVLVLENGRVEEFGTPAELIQAESGAFRTLCEKSGDMESLTKMIKW
ncbi:hypothetical protein EC988_003259 [Linderina pennispora]|nr:hypothetical protein EC988_003259 [Linderina pennispora]